MLNLVFFVYGLSSGYSLLQSNVTPLLNELHKAEPVDNVTTVMTLDLSKNERNLISAEQQTNITSKQSEIKIREDIRYNKTNVESLKLKNGKGFSEGRGRYKRRKIMKYLQPILVSVLVIKFILLPLALKALTALSASSFVMSKIALATAGIFVLKWLLSSSDDGVGYDGGAKERIEIVHLPLPLMKPYHKGSNGGWGDLSLSDSNNIFDIKPTFKRHKYIPVSGGVKDVAHVLAIAAAESVDGGGYRNARPMAQHYDGSLDGKPFL
ncbi:uncharacterized protein Osi13 [Eurosta solidaginis]|uniref:uncharacterized protein Osi13 n=1 Tax=Eurosta solidaginis TaxID=178769 RepID=UPI003531606C